MEIVLFSILELNEHIKSFYLYNLTSNIYNALACNYIFRLYYKIMQEKQPDVEEVESTETTNIVSTSTKSKSNQKKKLSKNNLFLVRLGIILLIFIVGVTLFRYISTTVSSSNNSSGRLLTYVDTNNYSNLIVNTSPTKTIAKLTLKGNDNTFEVITNNGQSVIVMEGQGVNNGTSTSTINKKYYLINHQGKITTLSNVFASAFNNSVSGAFLGSNNNYFYVSCTAQQCQLNNLNLTTYASSVLMTYSVSPVANSGGATTSLDLVGVSLDNLAYLITYPQTSGLADNFNIYNMQTKKMKITFVLPNLGINVNLPALSYDHNHLVYTSNLSPNISELTDISTTKTTAINQLVKGTNSGINNYVWSPDSKNIAYKDTGSTSGDSSLSTIIGYINVDSHKDNILKNLGNFTNNVINIDGWSANNQLEYTNLNLITTGTTTKSHPTFYAIKVPSGTTTAQPLPKGYVLVN